MAIISQSRLAQSLNNWKTLSDIPNQRGFEFIGLRQDGLQVVCRVVKRRDGSYTLAEGMFPRLTLWREMTEGDKEAITTAE